MSFIRRQRSLPGYKPNTSHCLYGLVGRKLCMYNPTSIVFFLTLCCGWTNNLKNY